MAALRHCAKKFATRSNRLPDLIKKDDIVGKWRIASRWFWGFFFFFWGGGLVSVCLFVCFHFVLAATNYLFCATCGWWKPGPAACQGPALVYVTKPGGGKTRSSLGFSTILHSISFSIKFQDARPCLDAFVAAASSFFFKWFAHILFLSGTFFLSKMSLNSVNYFIFPIDRFSFRKLISIDSRNSKCCKGNRVIGDLWKGARRFSRTQSSSTDKRRPVAKRAVRLNRFHSIAFHNCWTMCLGCRFFAEMKHRGARVQKENFRVLPMGIRGLFT